MKLEPRDRPLFYALLSIPFSVLVLLATLKFFPPDSPANQQAQGQADTSGGGKISLLDWYLSWNSEDYIALFTLCTLGVLIFQAIFMRDTVTEMRRSNDAAEAANAATQEAMNVADRPWYGILHVSLPRPKAGERLQVTIRLQNFGKSPAFKVRGGTKGFARLKELPAPEMPAIPPELDTVSTTLPGGGEDYFPFSEFPVLTQDDIDALSSGDLLLWAIAIAEYFDTGGGKHEHASLLKYNWATNTFGVVGEQVAT